MNTNNNYDRRKIDTMVRDLKASLFDIIVNSESDINALRDFDKSGVTFTIDGLNGKKALNSVLKVNNNKGLAMNLSSHTYK